MTLAARQQAFMAAIHDEDAALPANWTARHAAGLDIYRNNYRSALVEAIAATFERTQRWVGEESFRRAAAHHLILNPPCSWTLDDAGEGFDATLAELFAADPEVAELAALEWAMHRVFVSADCAGLTASDFAAQTVTLGDADWESLRFDFLPALRTIEVGHDVGGLWNALGSEDFVAPDIGLAAPHTMLVWREEFRPTFRLVDGLASEALALGRAGDTFGDICALLAGRLGPDEGVARAGALLGEWLQDGLIAALRR
ncbi:DNA-binding domain-containing protein [Parerythrobacter aurantius]|uniref:HvfC/BufC family peptide modification chaperone n=1 Tax=Parerythrobacter aurantius TaxID=3127706 RepID=UPI00324D7600